MTSREGRLARQPDVLRDLDALCGPTNPSTGTVLSDDPDIRSPPTRSLSSARRLATKLASIRRDWFLKV